MHKHELFIRGRSKRPGELLLGCRGCTLKFQAREYINLDGSKRLGEPYQTAKPKADKKEGVQLRLYPWQKKRIKANKTTAQKLLDEAVNNLPEA